MIKLYNLLGEVTNASGVNAGAIGGQENPKAIILAGAPGAGKGYVLKGLNISNLQVLNVDDNYIKKLKDANVSLDLKNATADERSKQAVAMASANKEFKGRVQKTIEAKQSFILDGTAGSFKQTSSLREELIKAGYEVFMLYVYTDLERSLKQNQDRFEKSDGDDRSLAPAIVLRTWNSVTQNYEPYKNLFGDNFTSVANTLEDEKLDDLSDIKDKYLTPFRPTNTIPKDDKAKARSAKASEKLDGELNALLSDDGVKNIIDTSVSKEEAQTRIKQFLS